MAVRKIVIVPTLLTLGNAVCGLASVAYASRIGKDGFSRSERLPISPSAAGSSSPRWCSTRSTAFAARLFKSAGRFGAELDSLCDAVSFGAAPAFLLLQLGPGWDHAALAPAAGGRRHAVPDVYDPAAGPVQRRVDRRDRQRQAVPRPAVAGRGRVRRRAGDPAVALGDGWPATRPCFEALATVGAFLVALLMVSQVIYPHLTKQILRGGRTAVPLILTAVVLLVLAREAAVALLFWGYALLGAGPVRGREGGAAGQVAGGAAGVSDGLASRSDSKDDFPKEDIMNTSGSR